MFGIGMPELMLIFVLALLVFGPKELPRIARTLGKAMAELRRASDELRDGIQREIELVEREQEAPSPPETVASTAPAEATPPAEEAHPDPTAAGAPAEGTETPPGTVAAEVPTEPIPLAPGEQVGETPDREMVEPPVTSPPPETSEAKEGPGAPAEQQPKPETSPGAPGQPAGTRNA